MNLEYIAIESEKINSETFVKYFKLDSENSFRI